MKAFLMHSDEDFDLQRELPSNEEDLTQDLELNILFNTMALGDPFLWDVAKRAVLSSLTSPEAILYRQRVLEDCLEHPSIVREIYDVAAGALLNERRIWGAFKSPNAILTRSLQAMDVFVGFLRELHKLADEHAGKFRSEGFARFFEMVTTELNDDYFETIEGRLKELRFRRGVLMSAELGRGNKGIHYVLRTLPEQSWRDRLHRGRSGYSFQLPDRDENGFKALGDMQAKGINLVANALAQSTDHIRSFFTMLRAELGFYVGCMNLQGRLAEKGEPTCFPEPLAQGSPTLVARHLYEICLALSVPARVAGSDVNAKDKSLVMITGANQGGKSTFLRSVGLAQLMMQSGIFVAAESFSAEVCDRVFTHYKREEDASMQSGKLDEELSRMSDVADEIGSNCILLCNESFAATNEREGSEIARQVIRAMVEAGVRVFFVTHLFDLAHGFYVQEMDATLFLRAERLPDGRRTFRSVESEPLPTSYGEDSYRRIFGTTPDASSAPMM